MPSGVYKRTKEHNKNISKALKGKKKYYYSRGNTGHKGYKLVFSNPKERGKKISLKLKGRKLSEKTKQKLREFNLGKKLSKETKKKISLAGWKGGIILARQRWREKEGNLEKERIAKRNWKLNNKEKVRFQWRQYQIKKLNNGGHHTFEEWENLKEKYNHQCLSCFKEENEIKLTEDHIVPIIKGGSNYIENIQPLCQSCNSRKYTKIISYV